MNKCLMLLLFLSALQAQAQRNIILNVDNSYVFADTMGKILVNQRFQYVEQISRNYGTYKVFKNGKKGVVRDFKLILPTVYDQVSVKYANLPNHAYILEQNNRFTLATGMGTLLTKVDYDNISAFEVHFQRQYSKTVYFLFKQGKNLQLASLDELNHFRFEIDTLIDGITTDQGCIVAQMGAKKAMYQLENTTGNLVKRFDFREVNYAFYPESFYIIYPKANKVEQYTYNCTLMRTLKGTTKVPELSYNDFLVGEEESVGELVEDSHMYNPDLYAIGCEQIKSGNYTNLLSAFQPKNYENRQIKQQLDYLAEWNVADSKGALQCTVKVESNQQNKAIRDTAFTIPYDEVKLSAQRLTTVVPVRKGKMWGVFNVQGKEVLDPHYTEVLIRVSDTNNEFIEAHTKQHAYLFYHDVKDNTTDTLLVGNPGDTYSVKGNQIFVKRLLKKHREQIGITQWMFYPTENTNMKAIKFVRFFDSIVAHPEIPSFTQCYLNGKVGLMIPDGRLPIKVGYDSLCLELCYRVEFSEYAADIPRYYMFQPIVLAYNQGEASVFVYNNHLLKENAIIGNANNKLTVSPDGLFLINDLGNNTVDLFSLSGNKLTEQPITFAPKKQQIAQFNRKYWFVQGKDAVGNDILVGRNGAWFVLPPIN